MNRKLKAKIIERYGSQFLFATTMGLHEASVSRIIRGRRALSPEDRAQWAVALGIDVNDSLFDGGTTNG